MHQSLTATALQLPVFTSDVLVVLQILLVSVGLGGLVYAVARRRSVDAAIVLGVMVAGVTLVNLFTGVLATIFSLVYVYVRSR